MKAQNYNNHVRYYTSHHFIFYPLISIFISLSLYFSTKEQENKFIWIAIAAVLGMMAWLSFMLRQHYALYNQNRIVRLEMRFRYYVLTQQRLELIESKISFGQLSALRFASDEELPELVQRTLKENLSPTMIKKSIKYWLPDYMRV